MTSLLSGLTLIEVVNVCLSLVTAVAASYLAYAALAHSAKPRARVALVNTEELRAGSTVLFRFSVRNTGYWYTKPMIVNMTTYLNFEELFTPLEMRSGSTQQNRNTEVKTGKGRMKYLKAKGMHLSHEEDNEEIHVVARLPKAAGIYRIKVSAFSDNGLSLSHIFKISVLPALTASGSRGVSVPASPDRSMLARRYPAIILVGCSGSGTTFLSCHLATSHGGFVRVVKSTTRDQRSDETTGIDYEFVDVMSFMDLAASNGLLHVQKSDFDGAYYGIARESLRKITQGGRGPLVTCHSLDEAVSVTTSLRELDFDTVRIYVYATETDRRKALAEHGEAERFEMRREVDVALKLRAYAARFDGCNYVLVNTYDSRIVAELDEIVSAIEACRVAVACDCQSIQSIIDADVWDSLLRAGRVEQRTNFGSVVSGYKSKSGNWLQLGASFEVYSVSENASARGIFSKA